MSDRLHSDLSPEIHFVFVKLERVQSFERIKVGDKFEYDNLDDKPSFEFEFKGIGVVVRKDTDPFLVIEADFKFKTAESPAGFGQRAIPVSKLYRVYD